MKEHIMNSEFFAGNRQRLRQLFTGTAPIVVTANGLLQKATDEAYPFRQDSSFWYLTGIDEPDIILIMDKSKEYLIVPSRETVRETFDGSINLDNLSRRSGIKEIMNEKEGWRQIEARLKRVQHVATLGANPKFIDVFGMYTNPARAELIYHLKQANSDLELLDLRPHMGRLRMVKQPQELNALQRAIDVTVATLQDVLRPNNLAKYGYEYEVEADITHGFRRRGARGHSFEPVVASGERACTMHYFANNGPLASDELMVIDVGADVDHYQSDLARTVSLGQVSRRHQQVHEAVQEAQDYAYSLLRPGVVLRDYEKQMEQFVGEKLRELGLIKTIDSEQVRRFFPHRTSHFLGLDTHDGGDYDRPLEFGVVLAVEPGIYVRDEGFGVRIEDDVVITNEGCKVLSAHLGRNII